MIVIVGAVGIQSVTQNMGAITCAAGEVYPHFGENSLKFALAGFGVLKCASISKMQKSPNTGVL